MPRPSENTNDGQQAAGKRARAALKNQDERRAGRPLEGSRATSRTRTGSASNGEQAS